LSNIYDTTTGHEAEQTAPGVRLLREVWGIKKPVRIRETAPKGVSTDIYGTANAARIVPRRHSPHR
jgi:hypothetical protein